MARYNPNRDAIDALNAKLDRIIELLEAAQPQPFTWPQYPMWPTYPAIPDPLAPSTASPFIVTCCEVRGTAETIVGDVDCRSATIGPPAGGYWTEAHDGRRVWYRIESTPTNDVSAVSMWTPQPALGFTVTTTH